LQAAWAQRFNPGVEPLKPAKRVRETLALRPTGDLTAMNKRDRAAQGMRIQE